MANLKKFLRPPGVQTEKDFFAKCVSCAQCMAVCTFKCIKMQADSLFGIARPRIYPQAAPCFLCMKCSDICPTDALQQVTQKKAAMGKAKIDNKKCLEYQDENLVMCWTCYEKCPLKGFALILEHGYIATIVKENCVGCGVCEYVCPVKAIKTTPTHNPEI